MIEKIVVYSFAVVTLDAFAYFFMNDKYRGYVGINDYLRLFTNPMYMKHLMTKIFVVNFIVLLFSILF